MADDKKEIVFGRPPKYDNVEELQNKISEYFNKGVKIKEVIIGRAPKQTTIKIEVPTITGLALYLGFESRQSFYDYEKYEDFSYTIKRARLFIEVEYEEQLQQGNTIGAIFALKNMGWKDKTETDITTKGDSINVSYYSKLSSSALKEIAKLNDKPEPE